MVCPTTTSQIGIGAWIKLSFSWHDWILSNSIQLDGWTRRIRLRINWDELSWLPFPYKAEKVQLTPWEARFHRHLPFFLWHFYTLYDQECTWCNGKLLTGLNRLFRLSRCRSCWCCLSHCRQNLDVVEEAAMSPRCLSVSLCLCLLNWVLISLPQTMIDALGEGEHDSRGKHSERCTNITVNW